MKPKKTLTAWMITYVDDAAKQTTGRIIHFDKLEAQAELIAVAMALREEMDDRLSNWGYDWIVDAKVAKREYPKVSKLLRASLKQVSIIES